MYTYTPTVSKEYLVRASYLELYNEDIRDLVSKNPNNKLVRSKERGNFYRACLVRDVLAPLCML